MHVSKNVMRLAFPRTNWRVRTPRRPLSIEHQGKPIPREDLFKYTSGRFLVDEEAQLSKRYVRFDVDQLCNVVAGIAGSATRHVSRIENLDGRVNRVLLMTTSDGGEYVAKIVCPGVSRPMYSTASEVAVLDFVKRNTSVPVPKVLAWNANATNAVGAEYIVMEKVPGVQLSQKWDGMAEGHRLILIKTLAQWESQLSNIDFHAYGGLYYRSSLKESEGTPAVVGFLDPRSEFCVGPSCDPAWLGPHLNPSLSRGPWKTLNDMGMSLVDRSLSTATHHPNQRIPAHLQRSWSEYGSILNTAKRIMPVVTNHGSLLVHDYPTLVLPAIHMGSIFVSDDIPGKITGFIGWQNSTVRPRFTHARFPPFLAPPEGYKKGGHIIAELPPNFEELNDENKKIALAQKLQATWAKAYEVSTCVHNRKTAIAIDRPLPFKDFLLRCGGTWDEGILPLRQTLIDLFNSPRVLGIGFREGQLDLHFTAEQIAQHREEYRSYQEWVDIREYSKHALDTDDDGWVSSERDFDEVRKWSDRAFAAKRDLYIREHNRTGDEIRRLWPFEPAEDAGHL
ncbi:uncharacterized protein N7459_007406 [Penicillium hispanicum]|uniref:uncharacterized protein n=1 Tax=Penicillium hispanicum TaxID=1080232 RepID=UPI002540DD19|nr:uncharacterized protein N7459_007406 [Penicillium hispanicum]KAJ5578442.1 hypothetical protein N7459_007406 [Penicillium hispanicum]